MWKSLAWNRMRSPRQWQKIKHVPVLCFEVVTLIGWRDERKLVKESQETSPRSRRNTRKMIPSKKEKKKVHQQRGSVDKC